MTRYRKVEVRIWNDAKFRTLSDDGKLVFLFLLTHPNLTALGAMRATEPGLASELGWTVKRFAKPFAELLAKPLIRYDEDAHFLVFPKFMKHNAPRNPNIVKSWWKVDDLLPECALKYKLYQHVKLFAEQLGEQFAKALPELIGNCSPNKEQEKEKEQEQEKETSPKQAPGPNGNDLAEEFEAEFWPNVPNKLSKADAVKEYVIQRETTAKELILAGLPGYCAYEQERSKKDGYQRLHPHRWLKAQRWTDEHFAPSRTATPQTWPVGTEPHGKKAGDTWKNTNGTTYRISAEWVWQMKTMSGDWVRAVR